MRVPSLALRGKPIPVGLSRPKVPVVLSFVLPCSKVLPLSKNIRPDAPQTKVSLVAATPKPRIVKVAIIAEGEESFTTGGTSRKAKRYLVKVEIGGVTGLLAPLLRKQPADTRVWILDGEAPAFVKSEAPLYLGRPICRIALTFPVWPQAPAAAVNSRN
jgi:hypothetical protein